MSGISDARLAAVKSEVDPVALMEQYSPKIIKQGSHFSACCPLHNERTPSLTVYTDQPETPYHCFGCGWHGDVIALVRALEHIDFPEAVVWLERYAGIIVSAEGERPVATRRALGVEKAKSADEWVTLSPVPPEALSVVPEVYRFENAEGAWEEVTPSAVHAYRDSDGHLLFFVWRLAGLPNGKVRPLSWARHAQTGETRWKWMYPPAPRPLYGLNKLSAHPDWPVVVCEGEKDVDAVSDALAERGYVAVASAIGAWNAHKTEWAPLFGRDVIIWPDAACCAGAHYAHTVGRILTQAIESARRKEAADTGQVVKVADAEVPQTLVRVLKEFGFSMEIVASHRGPVITQYELNLLDTGKRVKEIVRLEADLCLRLGVIGLRILAPLAGKKTVGIEVPHAEPEVVEMRSLLDAVDVSGLALPLIIGRDVMGRAMVDDLHNMPHLLIAGATGMGKSVCLNAIIVSLLRFCDPDELKFIMIDPKCVELAGYDGIPHLLCPPIDCMKLAERALKWATNAMDERFAWMRDAGVRNIQGYNKLGHDGLMKAVARKRGEAVDITAKGMPDSLPYIVTIIDEYADLLMVNKGVETMIVRLCQKARACGMHVILATQRPSSDVVTGLIKSNLPTRICFKVADAVNSRVVIDTKGGESLLGRGDMLYLANGASEPMRGQGVLVQDAEIIEVVERAKQLGAPTYMPVLVPAATPPLNDDDEELEK